MMQPSNRQESPTGQEDTQAVLLVGGMGTRLQPVLPSTPKALAPVGGRSFLELLIRHLQHQGIRRLVMCTGYLGDCIEREIGNGACFGVDIKYSRETMPMGTGGAIKLAQRCLDPGIDFLVMNGDSFVEIDFGRLLDFHRQRRALATMAVRFVENSSRYGTVQPGPDSRIVNFFEKTAIEGPGLINAGVYVFNAAIFDHIDEGPSSLERDLFPRFLGLGVYAYDRTGEFIDIGTPADYARATNISDRLYDAALLEDRGTPGKGK